MPARSIKQDFRAPPMTPDLGPPIEILWPDATAVPLVVSSPHSGEIYPPSLLQAVAIEPAQLRRLEDGCVDRLFEWAPRLGAPLLRARFARAYVDPNREAYELDPDLFDATALPDHINGNSVKARAGLGTIPSRVGGRSIYRHRLPFAEVERRVRLAYWPYHDALQQMLNDARDQFGTALLLDCHSMPSLTANGSGGREEQVDFALGDRYGRSCSPMLVDRAEAILRGRGFRVGRNRPYAGGYITLRYGQPAVGAHALQIEVRRELYMDEHSFRPHPSLEGLQLVIRELLVELADAMLEFRTPRRRAVAVHPPT